MNNHQEYLRQLNEGRAIRIYRDATGRIPVFEPEATINRIAIRVIAALALLIGLSLTFAMFWL